MKQASNPGLRGGDFFFLLENQLNKNLFFTQ